MRPAGVVQPWGPPAEPADVLARAMIAAVGRGPALGYMAGRVLGARSWWRLRRGLALLVAVATVR